MKKLLLTSTRSIEHGEYADGYLKANLKISKVY